MMEYTTGPERDPGLPEDDGAGSEQAALPEVDPSLPERLRADGTAAWPPRAAGLGIGVPEETESADAGEERRPREDARTTIRIHPDRTAANREGATAGHPVSEPGVRPAGGGRPAPAPASASRVGRTAALFRAESENSVAKGDANLEPAKEIVAEISAMVVAVGEAAGWRAVRFRATNDGRKEIAVPVVDREESKAFRMVWESARGMGRRTRMESVAGGERTAIEERTRTVVPASFPGCPGPVVTGTAIGESSGEMSNGGGFGYPRPLGDNVSEMWAVVRGIAGDKMRTGVAFGAVERHVRFSPGTDGATASARRPDTAAHPERSGGIAYPAVDMDVLALRAGTTAQMLDKASAWNAGLPDLSGVTLTESSGGGKAGFGRNPVRYAAATVPATPAPAAVPTVQVNATLRVDEEELFCAVERVAARQALRG